MSVRTFSFDSRAVEVSNAGKLRFPDDGITEGDLAGYYARVAEVMLPHVAGRPLSMRRFPNGIDERGFYAKQAPKHFPDWIDRVEIEALETGKKQPRIVANKAETLVYLVDQSCITPHTWLSRADNPRRPDKLIFDLDPPREFEAARAAAHWLRALLDELELPAYLMTTGSRGLHVGVPLDAQADFDAARAFARDLANLLAAREPKQLTTKTRKAARHGRLFLDYLRNAYAQTSVPPYAARARPGAPVATPLTWDELNDPALTSQSYTINNLFERLEERGDPWANFYDYASSLKAARSRLDKLIEKYTQDNHPRISRILKKKSA